MTVLATRLTGRVPHVEKELPTLPEHPSEFTTTTLVVVFVLLEH
jgi:hypothetical protein